MATRNRKDNPKGYLLDSNGELNQDAVRMYLYMMRHPSHFASNVIFTLMMILIAIMTCSGIMLLFGTTTLYIMFGFIALCYLIVRI